MNLEQRYRIPAGRQGLWDLLMDIQRVGRCIPGVDDIKPAGDGKYTGLMRVKIGPVTLGLSGTMTIEEADRNNWRAVLRMEASDRRVGGGVKSEVTLKLAEVSSTETELEILSDISFMGKLGELGQPVIRKKADTAMQEFARNLTREAAGQ